MANYDNYTDKNVEFDKNICFINKSENYFIDL